MSIELKKRTDRIVLMRKQGFTFQEIANAFKITRQRVHQIYKAGTKSLSVLKHDSTRLIRK